MLVSDAMTVDVVAVTLEASLEDVVERMLEHDVGSVIVERDGDPTGIVTTTDVLVATYRHGEPLSAIPVEDVMTHPLVTVDPDATVRAAVRRMGEQGVKRLAVTDGLDLVGILAQSDVVRNHSLLLQEAIAHEERRQRLEED